MITSYKVFENFLYDGINAVKNSFGGDIGIVSLDFKTNKAFVWTFGEAKPVRGGIDPPHNKIDLTPLLDNKGDADDNFEEAIDLLVRSILFPEDYAHMIAANDHGLLGVKQLNKI